MLYGLYLSTAGAKAQSSRLDVIANNIANVSTSGFRRQFAVVRARATHSQEYGLPTSNRIGDRERTGGGIHMYETPDDLNTQGTIQVTGRPYDLAIRGEGFFQVRKGNETYLTRGGSLTVDHLGNLMTNEGEAFVLGTSGSPIRVDPNQGITIARGGEVYQADAQVGQIALSTPAEPGSLARAGNSWFRFTGALQNATGTIEQAMLEGANVNPILEMADMIEISRAFEMNVNMIQLQNEGLRTLIQTVPRLA